MREIKFRAWDKKYGDMSSFDKMEKCKRLAIDAGLNSEQFIVLPQHENVILMQFTGLYDKNKTPIYEGDILGGHPHGTVSVEWNDEYACFESVSFENREDPYGEMVSVKHGSLLANDLKDCFDAWTVIGNIHENPDLLK